MVRNCLADHILYVYSIELVKRLKTTRYLSRKRRGRVFSLGGEGNNMVFRGSGGGISRRQQSINGGVGVFICYILR